MILHTVLPVEDVMKNLDEEQMNLSAIIEIQLGHAIMQIQPISVNQAKVIRYISPIAADYLNTNITPGSVITWFS